MSPKSVIWLLIAVGTTSPLSAWAEESFLSLSLQAFGHFDEEEPEADEPLANKEDTPEVETTPPSLISTQAVIALGALGGAIAGTPEEDLHKVLKKALRNRVSPERLERYFELRTRLWAGVNRQLTRFHRLSEQAYRLRRAHDEFQDVAENFFREAYTQNQLEPMSEDEIYETTSYGNQKIIRAQRELRHARRSLQSAMIGTATNAELDEILDLEELFARKWPRNRHGSLRLFQINRIITPTRLQFWSQLTNKGAQKTAWQLARRLGLDLTKNVGRNLGTLSCVPILVTAWNLLDEPDEIQSDSLGVSNNEAVRMIQTRCFSD